MLPVSKVVVGIIPVSLTAGATNSSSVPPMDTLGYKLAVVDVVASAADVVSNKPTVLKLQEADVTNDSSFADVTGYVGGTDFVIPNALTSTTLTNISRMVVPLQARKRYLRLKYSPQTTQLVFAGASLFRGEQSATNAAQAGVAVLIGG